jgi:hypothetical protein
MMMISDVPRLDSIHSILYLAAHVGDRPRRIDHYIDYFGNTNTFRKATEMAERSELPKRAMTSVRCVG